MVKCTRKQPCCELLWMFHIWIDTGGFGLSLLEAEPETRFLFHIIYREMLSGEGRKASRIGPEGKGRQKFGLIWRLPSVRSHRNPLDYKVHYRVSPPHLKKDLLYSHACSQNVWVQFLHCTFTNEMARSSFGKRLKESLPLILTVVLQGPSPWGLRYHLVHGYQVWKLAHGQKLSKRSWLCIETTSFSLLIIWAWLLWFCILRSALIVCPSILTPRDVFH